MDQEVAARALTRMRPIRMKQIVDWEGRKEAVSHFVFN